MEYLGENALIGTAVAGVAGAAIGSTVGFIAGKRSGSKSSRRRKKSKSSNYKKRNNTSRPKRRKLKFGSPAFRKRYLGHKKRKQKQPYTAGKRKDKSHRRIRYTKNNQPYIIQPDGRARFISKKTVRLSKKKKGGKY